MTDRPLSPQDLESLSAYLDNQLNAGDVKRLETRLAQNDGLRATLEDLKRTRLMLRSLPKVRAPRNFTLSAKMVGEVRRPQRSFWQLGSSWAMVSAMTVMLLMFTLMGDLMGVFTPAPLLAGGDASDAMSLSAEMEAMSEPAAEVALMAQPQTATPEESGLVETIVVTEADPVTPDSEATPDPGAEAARNMQPPANKEGYGAGGGLENPDAALTLEPPPAPLFTPAWVRGFEILLVGLAVVAAALALFLRRGS